LGLFRDSLISFNESGLHLKSGRFFRLPKRSLSFSKRPLLLLKSGNYLNIGEG
jgi:hypothetical protein